jgi:hypothetical protein
MQPYNPQDIAAAVFLAYACRTHTMLSISSEASRSGDHVPCDAQSVGEEGPDLKQIVISGLPPARYETVALWCSIATCVLLLLHRMYWGDDYGIPYLHLYTAKDERRKLLIPMRQRRREDQHAAAHSRVHRQELDAEGIV